jgi:hypothetical protein
MTAQIPVAPSRVAVFIDGDNLSASRTPEILSHAGGQPQVARVYAGAMHLEGWAAYPALEPVLAAAATPTRNATDMTLCVDAMHLALTGRFDRAVIASSDGDFTPLARRLRQLGVEVLGIGEAKTAATFRGACSRFVELSDASKPVPGPPDAAPGSSLNQVLHELLADGPISLPDLGKRLAGRGHRFRSGTSESLVRVLADDPCVALEGQGPKLIAKLRRTRAAQCASAPSPLPNRADTLSTSGSRA